MVRGLILVLALAGPAMAEQPTFKVDVMRIREARDAVETLLKHRSGNNDPEILKAQNEANNDAYLKTYERCMLRHGFKFRADVHYCAAHENPPHTPTVDSSLVESECYERIR